MSQCGGRNVGVDLGPSCASAAALVDVLAPIVSCRSMRAESSSLSCASVYSAQQRNAHFLAPIIECLPLQIYAPERSTCKNCRLANVWCGVCRRTFRLIDLERARGGGRPGAVGREPIVYTHVPIGISVAGTIHSGRRVLQTAATLKTEHHPSHQHHHHLN